MSNNLPTVTIGCPIRNREKYCKPYLDAILNLDYPKDNISLLFILNDSTDDTAFILNNFKQENSQLYHKIKIEIYNQNTPEDKRETTIREQYTYSSLSKLRNYWLSQVKTEFALSCDSDIMLHDPQTLNKLINHRKDFVAGLIINGFLYDKNNPSQYTNILKGNGFTYQHINKYPENTLIPVDFSGAVMLLSQKACKLGKFSWHKQGEDCGMSESLKKQGIHLWCDTSVKATHCMSEEYLDKYLRGEFIFV
jgi:glycosyltransferase involved in cell wall biosynthesis